MDGNHLVLRRDVGVLCAVVDRVGPRVPMCDPATLVLEHLRVAFEAGGTENEMLAAIADANREVFALSTAAAKGETDPRWRGMGATADVVFFTSTRAHIAHVGDGSVFRVKDGSLEELTVPDTLANDYRRARPVLTDADLAKLPAGVVVRALGMRNDVVIAQQYVKTSPGEVWLVCSRSLVAGMSPDQMLSTLSRRELTPKLVNELLALARTSTSNAMVDDITLVVHAVGAS